MSTCAACYNTGASGRSVLPNILVYIDVREGRPTAPSLFALSEARRVARLAGASVFAVALTAPLGTDELDALARPLAEAGADKLLLCEADDFAGAPLDMTHAPGLDAATARVPPMLVLFPAGGAGTALGPPLAARLGAPFAPWCDFLTTDADIPPGPESSGRVQLIRCRPDGRSRRRLDPLELERPLVATLGAGQRAQLTGRIQDLEVEVISIAKRREGPLPADHGCAPDPHAHLPLASVLVLVGDDSVGRPVISTDQLRGAVPAHVVVEPIRDVSPAVLAECCPDIVLTVGHAPVRTARSPRTRVVLAAFVAGPSDPSMEDVDVLWLFESPRALTAAAVAGLFDAFQSEVPVGTPPVGAAPAGVSGGLPPGSPTGPGGSP